MALTDRKLRDILKKHRTIAVCGMSRNQDKAAYYVPAFLEEKGYRIIPINPFIQEIREKKSYTALKDIPYEIDIVEVFRPSDQAPDIVKETIERRKKRGDVSVVWLQKGIRNEEARKLAEAEGILFVQDHCMKMMYKKLLGG